MAKQSITQRAFTLGEIREDFLEADDLEARGKSLQQGLNVRINSSGTLAARPGTSLIRETAADEIIEIRPASGVFFGLLIRNNALEIINESGVIVRTFSSVPWTSSSDVWVEPFRHETVIGGEWGLYVLTYNNGSWSLGPLVFSDASGGDTAQPFWAFQRNVFITPSARTGTITIDASANIWSSAYVGLRLRYGSREILITRFINAKRLQGVVQSQLPPSFFLTLSNSAGFKVGDAVEGQTTGYKGLIVSVEGSNIRVVTTEFFDGPDLNERISAPSASAEITYVVGIAPLPSPIWDEQLISPVRGYPRAGASAGGRLTLIDFPQVPDLVCMSSTREIQDFKVGADDDDAITRQCGDNAPRFMHVINAGDLLLFSDRGVYILGLREGTALTPSNFNPIFVDPRACNRVRPVSVGDGVVFVDASGGTICSVILDGNVYRKWSVRAITTSHSHLIKNPAKLCGPSLFSQAPEKYLFVVNEDGTLAAVSWDEGLSSDGVGFLQWETQGDFISVSPIFGGYWAIVDRDIGGENKRFLEMFDDDAMMDCQVPASADENITAEGVAITANGSPLIAQVQAALPFIGAMVHLYGDGFYAGDGLVGDTGIVDGIAAMPEGMFAGFNFRSVVRPWPAEHVQMPKGGVVRARVIRGSVSVLNTRGLSVRANNTTKARGGYEFGDDLSLPPPLKTQRYGFIVVGNREHPRIEITKEYPGEFHVLAITQEVTF